MTQPKVEDILNTKRGFPIFGSSLSFHLASFPLPSGIAYPIQLCVTRLVMLGLEEEGLFRLAAGSSKVKKLRAEMEAGLSSLSSLETADHHVLTATVKSYLRELPDPLMGADLYQEWLEAGQLVSRGYCVFVACRLVPGVAGCWQTGKRRLLSGRSMQTCSRSGWRLANWYVENIIE